ncbi:MAG TPA: DUF4198 domain-containing protein, partial [Planctomycetota bacterium]|nr:DUF4198 domain-containing protein [Planctomycetota bacterium]
MGRSLPAMLALFALVSPLAAHEFWIVPSTFEPAEGELLRIGLEVGDLARGDAVPRDSARIVRFALLGPGGERPVVGLDGRLPAGAARVGSPGLWAIGYESRPAFVELAADPFEAYLREKGLERVIALRAERGESGAAGRELFSRCAKSLVRAGGSAAAGGRDRGIGLALELMAERDPFGLGREGAGMESLPVSLRYRGEPLPGALVAAYDLDAPGEEAAVEVRTDGEGRAVLRLPRPGRWMIAA